MVFRWVVGKLIRIYHDNTFTAQQVYKSKSFLATPSLIVRKTDSKNLPL